MKKVSVQDLKSGLSAAIAEAEAGETIVITRHNEPVAQLTPLRRRVSQRGSRAGTGRVEPAIRGASTGGRYLAVLLEDRGGR